MNNFCGLNINQLYLPYYTSNDTYNDSSYNHLYNNSIHLILRTHTDIHHECIFALDDMPFHSVHVYAHTIHAELKILFHLLLTSSWILCDLYFCFGGNICSTVWIINSITISNTLINADRKLIIKGFIRVYIDECWFSLTWLII